MREIERESCCCEGELTVTAGVEGLRDGVAYYC
jgi:hypothetical protein